MKTFIHHDIPALVQVNSDKGRYYETPSGNKYPSVTGVVGFKNEDSIKEWRDKVGEEEANKISARASSRGTRIHSLCEEYLKGQNPKPSIFDQELFLKVIPELEHINNIHCLETKLYSDRLEVAGTVDVIAEYRGVLSVIDFKTSKRIKQKEEIPSYFQQTSAYSYMFWEHTGLTPKQLVIIMGVDDEQTLVHIEPVKKWLGEFMQVRKEFKECKGY